LDDSWSRFWERLIADWVIVGVGAFVLQGLWFGLVSLLTHRNPDLEADLAGATSVVGVLLLLAALGGFVVGFFRAQAARRSPYLRR
jgi:hypothetical protein